MQMVDGELQEVITVTYHKQTDGTFLTALSSLKENEW